MTMVPLWAEKKRLVAKRRTTSQLASNKSCYGVPREWRTVADAMGDFAFAVAVDSTATRESARRGRSVGAIELCVEGGLLQTLFKRRRSTCNVGLGVAGGLLEALLEGDRAW